MSGMKMAVDKIIRLSTIKTDDEDEWDNRVPH